MERELDLAPLKKGMLFRNMTDEEILQTIAAMSPHRAKYPRRTVVAQDGDLFPDIGIILSGNLRLAHVDSNGNNNLLYVLKEGDTVGELNAVGRYKLHLSISTGDPTEILYLSVEQLLRKNVLTAPTQIRFLQNLTLAVAKKGQYLTHKLEDSIRRSTRERLQDYLSAQYQDLVALAARDPAKCQRQGGVLQRIHAGDQAKALKDKADVFPAERRPAARGHAGGLLAAQRISAACWAVEQADQVHQGGLARTGRAQDGRIGPAGNVQIHAVDRAHTPPLIYFTDIPHVNQEKIPPYLP